MSASGAHDVLRLPRAVARAHLCQPTAPTLLCPSSCFKYPGESLEQRRGSAPSNNSLRRRRSFWPRLVTRLRLRPPLRVHTSSRTAPTVHAQRRLQCRAVQGIKPDCHQVEIRRRPINICGGRPRKGNLGRVHKHSSRHGLKIIRRLHNLTPIAAQMLRVADGVSGCRAGCHIVPSMSAP